MKYNDEQFHQKLKHSCKFDKKQRSKIIFLSIKLYIRLTHARSHFQVNTIKEVAKMYIKMMFKIWQLWQRHKTKVVQNM